MSEIVAPTPEAIVESNLRHIHGNVESMAIIGSYLIYKRLRPGSDIDVVVVVDSLDETEVRFGDVFYKDAFIEDSQGRRKELNIRLNEVPIDITIIDPDSTNEPNNPLTDYYENYLGLCLNGLTIYGKQFSDVLRTDQRIERYMEIRSRRLGLVEKKIDLTKQKIVEQERDDLHIIYELQRYVFIRECIARPVFNFLSIKHPEKSIPDFNEIFDNELASCGLELQINHQPKS